MNTTHIQATRKSDYIIHRALLFERNSILGYYLTVVEWKDYHFLAVATISDFQNSYCNQWPHPYEPQISSRFVFSAVCLHFTAILVKFSEKTSAIKTKSPQK